MSRCILGTVLRVLPNTSLTSSRAFSGSKCLLANHYKTLKVSPNATAKEIKQAYFKLSKENHPDLHPNDPTSHEKFIQLQKAYKVLSSAASRKEYDVKNNIRRRGAYYNQNNSQRPYDDPDFSFRDEWLRKQNEKMKEMRYGEHFGRRADDPKNFYSYYNEQDNLMNRLRKFFIPEWNFPNFVFVIAMTFVCMSVPIYMYSVRHHRRIDVFQERTKGSGE